MLRLRRRWESRVEKHFGFLTDYGFRLDRVDDERWGTTVAYLSASLGVEITRSVEYRRVEVALLRLSEGQPPEPEVWVTEAAINRVLFDNVLEARAPDVLGKLPSGLSLREVEEQLHLYAQLLRVVVPDFLEGSDVALRDGERVVRSRVRESPQQVTVWLPTDASEADETEARARAERATPSEVRVVVKRYER